MQLEALQQAGADRHERTATRTAHRNGTRDRSLVTRYGELTLSKPQLLEKPFETQVFGKYAWVEKALVNAIAESYLQGVSTRKVEAIIAYLGIDPLSPSSVSRIAQDLDREVHKFLSRPIERPFPYLFLDASYYTVRDCPRYVSKALLVTAGVREDGYREVLGATIADCENEAFWSGFFDDLKERGLTGFSSLSPRSSGDPGSRGHSLPGGVLADVPGPHDPGGPEKRSEEGPVGGRRYPPRSVRQRRAIAGMCRYPQ